MVNQHNDSRLIFRNGGGTNIGLMLAQEFFEKHAAKNVNDLGKAMIWLTEEVGELAHIIRIEDKERYKDGLGDILMWLFTLSRLLDENLAKSLEYSVDQLVAAGFTDLPPEGDRDLEHDR